MLLVKKLFQNLLTYTFNSFQLTFVDEVSNGSGTNGGRQLVPGLLYIDDKAPKYKVIIMLLIIVHYDDR